MISGLPDDNTHLNLGQGVELNGDYPDREAPTIRISSHCLERPTGEFSSQSADGLRHR